MDRHGRVETTQRLRLSRGLHRSRFAFGPGLAPAPIRGSSMSTLVVISDVEVGGTHSASYTQAVGSYRKHDQVSFVLTPL